MSQPWSWKGQRPLRGWRSVVSFQIPWEHFGWPVLFLAFTLVTTGLVFVQAMAEADLHAGRDGIYGVSFSAHLKKIIVAFPCLVFGLLLRPRWLRKSAWAVYLGSLVLLALVPVIGEERNNAMRWIPMPMGFDLQPSELAKLGLIIVLARVLYRSRLEGLGQWFQPALLALIPMVMVMAQPDLGTALTIVPVTLGMGYLAGASGRAVLTFVAIGGLLATSAYQFEWIQGYQKKRVDVWAASFDSQVLIDNKNGPAFHPYQARVAIGDGGLRGAGLGRGVANEAGHLPERESDSIFAVIAEETGFIGASVFVFVYLTFSGALLILAGRVRERFSRLVVGGVGLYFVAHFFIHASVNLGILPMTGLTLPLVSTGGSSLLASFLALGLALGLASRQEPSLDLDAFRS